MNTTNSLVDRDECLSLFAKLGQLTRQLTLDDVETMPGYPEVALAAADARQALDAALQLRNWAQHDVLESVEVVYAQALGNADEDIALGLIAYLDHLSGVQVPYVNTEGQALTFGVVCQADMTQFEAIGAFKDVGPLRTWIASYLAVPEASITVHAMPGLPDTIFESLYDFTAELGRAMSKPAPEDYCWSLAQEPSTGNATDLVFWVSFSSEDTNELQRVADTMGHVLEDDSTPVVTLPLQLADREGELELLPCAVMWPFSACTESVFNPVLDSLDDAVARLEERGFSPETISAELVISLEEDNLYGFDESFVIELRDLATGFILARVPGFSDTLFDMFTVYFLNIGIDYGFAEMLVRPEKGEAAKRYIRDDDE
jgi:hypothetical protein